MLMLRSVLGLVALIACAWLLSSDRRRVPWRAILVGLALQFAFALFILRTPFGVRTVDALRVGADAMMNCVDTGSRFVFGADFKEHFFAFKVLPTVIFMGALMSLLYYYGILQRVVAAVGWVMQRTMGTSGAESLCAAANIFAGQTEAPLVVRPYIDRMTQSELLAVMIGGGATIAGGVMAAFIGMGIDAGHLLTASVISAPASLLIAKVMLPETEQPETRGDVHIDTFVDSVNAVDAISQGALDGLKLSANIAAMIIAFLGLITLADLCLQSASGALGQLWTLSDVLGLACWPFAWLMGVTPGDERIVGELIGLKIVTNEFLAYEKLVELQKLQSLSPHSQMIAIYALCGFANIGSIGIQIGGLGMLAPNRRADLARLGVRAMIGGNLATFLTACIAGIVSP